MAEYLAPTLDGADIVSTVRANGLELAYEQFGRGDDPALLLIMGLGTQLTGWPDAFCRALADKGLRVIRFDNRDVGLSSRIRSMRRYDTVRQAFFKSLWGREIKAAYALEDMADDVLGLLDGLGIEKAHLVGASMGGMIAQIMAATRPERVLTLTSIMSTTSARGLPRSRFKVLLRMARQPKNRDKNVIAAYQARTLKLIGSPKYGRSQASWKAECRRSLERSYYPAGGIRQTLAVLAALPRDDLLGAVHCPALIIHGANDPMLPVKHGRATAEAMPHARYEEIPGMGHDLPPRLLPRFVAWISELTRSVEREQSN
jgi:pimeloyl-ACP methyl ester carboxylesterase